MNAPAFPPRSILPDSRTTPGMSASAVPPTHDARNLTGPGGLARILLDGQAYALRITRQGKLILTK